MPHRAGLGARSARRELRQCDRAARPRIGTKGGGLDDLADRFGGDERRIAFVLRHDPRPHTGQDEGAGQRHAATERGAAGGRGQQDRAAKLGNIGCGMMSDRVRVRCGRRIHSEPPRKGGPRHQPCDTIVVESAIAREAVARDTPQPDMADLGVDRAMNRLPADEQSAPQPGADRQIVQAVAPDRRPP